MLVPAIALLSGGPAPTAVLSQVAMLFGLAVVVIVVFHYLRIHYVVGYLLTGILVGPSVFNLVGDQTSVSSFAEVGVILLMFTIGLEFNLSNLKRIQKYVTVGGGMQFFLTFGTATILTYLIGSDNPGAMNNRWAEAMTWGFLWAPSSTAIVVKLLQDRNILNTEPGRGAFGVLLFQDLMIVPIILAIPLLAGVGGDPLPALLDISWKMVALAMAAVLLAKFIVPWVLKYVMQVKSQEVFLLATVAIGLGVTLATGALGLSLALGAFIAGLLIAETDYNRLAISCILPFRYVFISFFFLSLGMLLDLNILLTNPLDVLFWFVMCLVLKFVCVLGAMRTLRMPRKHAIQSALYLMQIGEFSFIIAQSAQGYNLISMVNYQVFLAVSILSMAVTPYAVDYAQRFNRSPKTGAVAETTL